jgi:hypothetical protein
MSVTEKFDQPARVEMREPRRVLPSHLEMFDCAKRTTVFDYISQQVRGMPTQKGVLLSPTGRTFLRL